MKKLAVSLLFTGTFLGLFLNASDFKSMDDKQLLEQAGKVAPSEVPEFRAEVNKRLAVMKEEDRKNYKADFKKAMDKNLASLSQEDRNKRKKEILEAIANKKKTMTMKEYREEGLDLHDCACEGPFHDHERKKGKKPSHHKH
ncbi:DUF1104 domain-containing protein [Helicobacter pylori]|jgi:Protein of unknown function (DUF1104).|uniref:DUF1104 domain-containing protein n=2 Tax=Helicobacter pylori TaxID=210 RepID=O24943_HELPY|nr:DUF1104 domain-containing protein [Helicobacter pylori]AAD07198.1 predicted coding region HP0129 [Helicobacter pylori 26695]AFV41348.1 hypothetical protein C694_00635 [Helicobacter pylori 26695]AFV42942.1 hypothetical protein C695_00635 [Helicobacter pylori Rif1]AFV44537.1 hypothetical protein C730_00635 [Helicobacter pylori Rif2]AJF08443.1 hypothetical protein SE87_00675 [Helicobacter pylori 26695-1]